MQVAVSVEVDDVVEVARPTTLGHRSNLLGEQLVERVAPHGCRPRQRVRIGMSDRAEHRRTHDTLI
jgi:hypothetical protein